MRLNATQTESQHDLAAKSVVPMTAALSQLPAADTTAVGACAVGACDVGETRLTPQEAAETIASLERERLAREQHAAGTISINEVIEQFGLSATPEEILAALAENRRVRQEQAPTQRIQAQRTPGAHRSRLFARIAMVGAYAFIVWLLFAMICLLRDEAAVKAGRAAVAAATAAANAPPALQPVPPTLATAAPKPFAALVDGLVVIDKTSGQPVSKLMSEVPDGRSVQVQDATLEATLSLHQTDSFTGGTRTGWWTARKEHQRLFLKGFLPIRVSAGVASLGNIIVANHSHRPNDTEIGPAPTPVWVPADRISSIDSFYGTDAGIKEGDNSSGTAATVTDDWSRITMDGLKVGELRYDPGSAKR